VARLLYACRFDIEGTNFESLMHAYGDWIQAHYLINRGKQEASVDWAKIELSPWEPASSHLLAFRKFEARGGRVGQIDWTSPTETSGLRWKNDITIGANGDRNSVEHLISVDSVDYQISPVKLLLGSPRIIRELCSRHTVRVGQMRLRAEPYKVDGGNLQEFFGLLESPLRKLPIVFLSSYSSGPQNLIDADNLARRMAGVAIIVHATEGDVTWAIRERIGRTLSCFNGGARIYWPHFSANDDQRRHPLFLGSMIEVRGESTVARTIEGLVFGIACYRFAPDPDMRSIVRASEDAARVAQLEAQKATSGLDWEAYALEIDGKLGEVLDRVGELEAENANLKANQNISFVPKEFGAPEIDVSVEAVIVSTVAEAVAQASSRCKNLVILPPAERSAKACPFQRPQEVLDALEDLDEIASEWSDQKKKNGSGGDLYQHLLSRGWGKRCSMHISDTTRSKHRSSYTFEYGSEKLLFEPHVTLGSGDANSCASIHFIHDHELGKIVVGHVGRHLPNTKS
jgi:hypothetical protein